MLSLALAACGGETAQTPSATSPAASPTAAAAPTAAISPAQQAQLEQLAAKPVVLLYGDQRWQPSAKQIGATASVDGSAIKVAVDQAALRSYLESIAPAIAQNAVNATVIYTNTELIVTPSTDGLAMDVDATASAATAALAQGQPAQVQITTKPAPAPVGVEAAEAAKAQAQAFLAQPLKLTIGGKDYPWDAETVGPLLSFTADGQKLKLSADRAALAERIALTAKRTEKPAKEPRVSWNGGDLKITAEGENGTRVDEAKAVDMIAAAIEGGSHSVTLPTTTSSPRVTSANLDTLGIKEVVATGKSDFTGSAKYRITNILAGMKLLNGILIGPGDEFSFNNTVGEIDESNGFVQGYAIIQNRTQLEFGGGICQDSTTVFRAAFWAGLPITERKEHTYYISWYNKYGLGSYGDGPGLDAAIFTGVQDLKFVNDTGHWLLMQATADPKQALAQVTLFGTKPNRTVTLTQEIVSKTPAITTPEYYPDPQQPVGTMKRTDTARGGMTIQVFRTITENGTERKPELFRTVFRPWPNKYAVNPADMGANGQPVFLSTTITPTATIDPNAQPTPDPNAQPTIDPALLTPPTTDPNAPAQPTADPNAQPQPTADPNAQPQPTADPNAQPQPTADPNAQPQPTADPNAQPQPTADPNAQPQPTADPNAQPPANG
ncbi:vanomycin resistance protein VanB [Chloroflexia bacterium SDU3-3]|nr:vanomycin resistance protein VanB [Chloroflexia bacterium SDU3-3]